MELTALTKVGIWLIEVLRASPVGVTEARASEGRQ
jgi:hypothetical protein